jgi:hypothetical protein
MEQLSEPGTELAVEDGAAAGPAHPLRLVHTAVDQEVGHCSGQRGADPKTGTMALGIVDQPSVLAGQIAVELAQGRPEPARWGYVSRHQSRTRWN